jgi:hypothetical protein
MKFFLLRLFDKVSKEDREPTFFLAEENYAKDCIAGNVH